MPVNKISKKVYHQHVKGPLENNQNRRALALLREIAQPLTVRMLHRIMNARGFDIDLVSLRRSITNLTTADSKGVWHNEWKRPMLTVAFERECPITKKRVGWYAPVNNSVQFDLFQQNAAA